LAALLVVVGAILLAEHAWSAFLTLGYVVAYVANYAWNANHLAAPVQHCWSLSIEEQFYLVWPVVLVALLRFRNRWLITASVAALTAAVLVHRLAGNGPTQPLVTTSLRADELLIGCLLACLFAWFRAVTWTWWPLALGAVPLLVAQVWHAHDLRGFGYTAIALLFAFVLAGSITWKPLGRLLSIDPLRWLGRISYSLYLWHYPVIYLIRLKSAAGIDHATVVNSIAALGVSLVLAVASYELIEKPFIQRRRDAVAH
jgi:peptidoglycan/LPS O-acetylase OafA/YrhL